MSDEYEAVPTNASASVEAAQLNGASLEAAQSTDAAPAKINVPNIMEKYSRIKVNNTFMVAKREITTRIHSRIYRNSTIMYSLIGIIFTSLAGKSNNSDAPEPEVAKAAEEAATYHDLAFNEVMKEHGLDPSQILAEITEKTNALVEAAGATVTFDFTKYIAALIIAMCLMIALTQTGNVIAQGIAEEKGSKVVEILLSSLKPVELILGKVLGIGFSEIMHLGIVYVVVYGSAMLNGVGGGGSSEFSFGQMGMLAILWFIIGYAMFAALFAALACSVQKADEVPMAIAPIMLIVCVGFFMSVYSVLVPNSTGLILTTVKFMPFFAPFCAPIAMINGHMTVAMMVIALIINIITVPITFIVATKLYTNSIQK
ncbi:MAG: ABC transporter permease [Bifidobacteriaceae bacterium]|jgi:ABC-type Na+ efflux pump permease subunit|nr:ABC transporter permease [Bifidobacteriaceae bacterium]